MMRAIKKFLRSPRIILGEIVALGIVSTAGAILPEKHIFQGFGFILLALLASASLWIVILEQFRRRRMGSVFFHTGLFLIIIAGIARALFASEAVVDLVEGETLPPTANGWSGQWPGLWAQPFQLDQEVRLEAVRGSRYNSGDLFDLRATLSVGELAVNRQLKVGGKRLHLGQDFGPAAVLEWPSGHRTAVLLDSNSREGSLAGPAGLCAYLRANTSRATSLEVRVMRGSGLVTATELRVGETLPLPGGASLTLHGIPLWARLHGSHDPALWLAGLGFTSVLVGAMMLFVLKPLNIGHQANRCARLSREQEVPA